MMSRRCINLKMKVKLVRLAQGFVAAVVVVVVVVAVNVYKGRE